MGYSIRSNHGTHRAGVGLGRWVGLGGTKRGIFGEGRLCGGMSRMGLGEGQRTLS